MATLGYQSSQPTGTALNLVAASAGGDKLPSSDSGALVVRNGGASPVTVTLVTPAQTKYGQADPDVPVVVAAGATTLIGPLPKDLENPSDGLVAFTYSAVTSVTVGAVTI